MPEWEAKRRVFRLVVTVFFLTACVGLEFFFHLVFDISRVYTHFYYIPIILAAFWWGIKGGLATSLFLSSMHIANHYPGIEAFVWARGLALVFMGCVVGMIGKRRLGMETDLRRRTHELDESVKELNCLYEIARLVETEGITLEEILAGVVELVPRALECPEISCARICIYGSEYKTENFTETSRKWSENIVVHNEQAGILEACLIEEKPRNHKESLFNEEEIKLLHAVAERLGRIIERKKAEEALKTSNRLRKLFTDILIHDLMNPLLVISGSINTLNHDELKDDAKENVEMIRRAVSKMKSLVIEAVEFAKLQDKTALEKKEIDLDKSIKQVIMDLSPFASEKRIKVEFENKTGIRTKANEILGQVFMNLLSNAIKYSPEDTTVVIGLEKSEEKCRVCFRDRGDGIPDEHKDTIFTRFERIYKGPIKGTGLGLAIARTIINLHDGRIWVEDNPGGGSAFVVELPL